MEKQSPSFKITINDEDVSDDDDFGSIPGKDCKSLCGQQGTLAPDQQQTSPEKKSDVLDTSSPSSANRKSVSFGGNTDIGFAHPYSDENEECVLIRHVSEHPPTPIPSFATLSRYAVSEEDLPEKSSEKLREDSLSPTSEPLPQEAKLYTVSTLTGESDFSPHDKKSETDLAQTGEFSNGEVSNCESFRSKQQRELDLALVVAEEIVKDACQKLVVKDSQEMSDASAKYDIDLNPSRPDTCQEEMHLNLISNASSRRQITRIEEEDSNDPKQANSFENNTSCNIKKRLSNVTISSNSVGLGCEETLNEDLHSNLHAILKGSSIRQVSEAIDAIASDLKRGSSFPTAEKGLPGNALPESDIVSSTEKRLDRISVLKDFLVEMRNQILEEDKPKTEILAFRVSVPADAASGGFDSPGDSSDSTTSAVIQPEQQHPDVVSEASDPASSDVDPALETSPKTFNFEDGHAVAMEKTKTKDVVPDSMSVEGFSFQPPMSAKEGSVTAAGEGSCDEGHHLAPVLEGREIGLNEDLVRGSLSVFSVKGVAEGIRTSSKVQPSAPPLLEIAERYSFCNLWRPEISNIECLKACGKESLEGILESACKKDSSAVRAQQDDPAK